jgi:hypothetical protein
MAFERFHPDRNLQRNLLDARQLRAEYLRGPLTRLFRVRDWVALRRRSRVPTARDGGRRVPRSSLSLF